MHHVLFRNGKQGYEKTIQKKLGFFAVLAFLFIGMGMTEIGVVESFPNLNDRFRKKDKTPENLVLVDEYKEDAKWFGNIYKCYVAYRLIVNKLGLKEEAKKGL